MLITTRTHQMPGWATARGEPKICRRPRTHSIWSRDHRPATRRLCGCILHSKCAKFEQNRSSRSRVMRVDVPKIWAFAPSPDVWSSDPRLDLATGFAYGQILIACFQWTARLIRFIDIHWFRKTNHNANLASLIYHQSHCTDSLLFLLQFSMPLFTTKDWQRQKTLY